jgi:hypothetical protein
MAIEKARIEGTHIPTKIPESLSSILSPENHRVTEYKNDKNAKTTG